MYLFTKAQKCRKGPITSKGKYWYQHYPLVDRRSVKCTGEMQRSGLKSKTFYNVQGKGAHKTKAIAYPGFNSLA